MNNQLEKQDTSQKYVTAGFDGHPTIVVGDGAGLTRDAELIIHAEYYPNWPEEKWPVDPVTKEKLPINHGELAMDHTYDTFQYITGSVDKGVGNANGFEYEPEGLGAVLWMFIILLLVLIITGIFYLF